MTDRELLKQTLDALELHATHHECGCVYLDPAITALREALAESALERMAENARELGLDYEQPAQEPVAWAIFTDAGNARMWSTFQPHLQKLADAEGLTITPLYTSPPAQRKPLTDEEIREIVREVDKEEGHIIHFARAIEAAHGIKGDA